MVASDVVRVLLAASFTACMVVLLVLTVRARRRPGRGTAGPRGAGSGFMLAVITVGALLGGAQLALALLAI